MKIVFMGTPDFSVPALDALVDAEHEIVAVYSQPARPAGRGKKMRDTPVAARAKILGLNVYTPLNFKSDAAIAEFLAHDADVAVVVAYGLILPQVILDGPKRGCLNIHASLLPRWRGAAPIHRAIMAGDSHSGVAIMQMEAGLDTGPVLMVEETTIGPSETTGDLHDRLAQIGAGLMEEVLLSLDHITPNAQPELGVTYAHKIDKGEARIDWAKSAQEIDQQIRGLSPFPGAWCEADGERIKILRSSCVDQEGPIGAVFGDLIVTCGTGAIQILAAQRPGKKPQNAAEFLNGFSIPEAFT
ncbi:methionyl-tRNA formyl transferase [Rhodobacterales bacterium HTCC2150]|nr:methionyl-tRNA formyl transferase [Rhodobacterales bacterium HTCC2150] [Rhodobacteraceae bacterium HTCC2150]